MLMLRDVCICENCVIMILMSRPTSRDALINACLAQDAPKRPNLMAELAGNEEAVIYRGNIHQGVVLGV